MLRLVCWRWQEGKLPLPYRFTAVGPLWQPCAPHPLQDRGEATSRRRPRNGEDGSSAWNSCRWFVHRSRRHFTIIWKTGFQTGFSWNSVYMSPFREKTLLPTGCRPKDLSPPPINFSFGTLGRMVKPVKRFQHEVYDSCFGSAPAPRAAHASAYARGPGSIPGSAPNAQFFFAPWGYANPKTPLCTAEPRAPSNALAVGPSRRHKVHETPVARLRTRLPQKTSARDRRKNTSPPKISVLKVPQVLIFKVVVLPRQPSVAAAWTASPSLMVAAACARASAPIKAPAPPHYPPELHQQRASPARRPRKDTSYFGVAALFSNSSSP